MNNSKPLYLKCMAFVLIVATSVNQVAALCGGYIEYYDLNYTDGGSRENITCDPGCIVNANHSECKSSMIYDPDPPAAEKFCIDGYAFTGYKCKKVQRSATVTYFLGVPYCSLQSNGSCSSGCADWQPTRSSESVDWSWDELEPCSSSS